MLKNNLITIFMILSVGLLLGCSSSNGDNVEDEASFTGTIEEMNDQSALVLIEEGSILNSGNLVVVDLSVAPDTLFEMGDKVKVGYDGLIRESHPLGINTTSVELVDN